ncbi:MAG: peptide deformylase [Clostridiales bacterium GWC2_40_7]|nr:MAG: peptide deformylase [Clostridiales bacterium GWC2_40_7]
MAIRIVRKEGDEVLRKKAKPVEEINDKITVLLKDMVETMYKYDGVGLAAPQIGVLKRIVVIDAGEKLYELINPVIIDKSGEQNYIEGCLSIPGVYGEVIRPAKVKVEAMDANGSSVTVEGEGMLAVVLCHEIDHLDGILYKDKAIRMMTKEELERESK